jgi:negative regulator of sigma E activity
MSRLDDELRWALRRREPSQDFAERVLARIALQDAAPIPARNSWWRALLPGPHSFEMRRWNLRWAMVGALACLLAVTVGVHRYRVNERTRAEGEVAKAQVMLALQIASAKLNFAQRKVLSRQDERNPRRVN